MRGALIAALLAALPSLALAQATIPTPQDYAPSDQRAQFRVCRAAILIEMRAGESDRTVLPPAVVEAMREQVDFIMADTIFNVPALSMEDGAKRMEFTERFVLEFGKTVGAEIERLDARNERAATLIECQPFLWEIMKERIDLLMRWRQRALGLDRPFPVHGGAEGE